MNRKIVLASKSPRRKKLLEQLGLKFEIRESAYEEDMTAYKDPYKLAKFLALEKGREVMQYYDDAIIISADTFVVCENRFIGKPKSKDEVRYLFKKFMTEGHTAITGYAIIDTKNNHIINNFGEVTVWFKELSDQEIEDYIETGEPFDKAGGYGIQDKAAAFVKKVEGDYFSAVGLPLNKVYSDLLKLGVNIFN